MTKPTYEELEAEIERLKSANNGWHLRVQELKTEVQAWNDKDDNTEKQLQELTALCTAQAEALKKILSMTDQYEDCQDIGKVADEALSSPPSQKLLRRMEVYSKALVALKKILSMTDQYDECRDIGKVADEILQQAKEAGLI